MFLRLCASHVLVFTCSELPTLRGPAAENGALELWHGLWGSTKGSLSGRGRPPAVWSGNSTPEAAHPQETSSVQHRLTVPPKCCESQCPCQSLRYCLAIHHTVSAGTQLLSPRDMAWSPSSFHIPFPSPPSARSLQYRRAISITLTNNNNNNSSNVVIIKIKNLETWCSCLFPRE